MGLLFLNKEINEHSIFLIYVLISLKAHITR